MTFSTTWKRTGSYASSSSIRNRTLSANPATQSEPAPKAGFRGSLGMASRAVADGLAKTARVITAAAAIMVVVFLSFVTSQEVFLKLFGIGLATAVFLDATVVRLVLVPAVMQLLGKWNWWTPNWLERILPRLDVERVAVGTAGTAGGRP